MEAAQNVERIGRFEIVRKIASGGMATVSLACLSGEAGFRRLVAIKRLHPHLADEPDFVNMFFDEARLAARIHHPNVVPILEIGKEGKERFLVMEYVEGATLEQLGRQRRAERIPTALAIRMILDALAGLQAAHDLEDDTGSPLEIVHRDVSPQNILVGLDGLARLTDFGIARAASRVGRATRSGQFKGKLTYSAPEQVLGHRMDRRTDVYAMGIVFWEALTGERLFDADSEAEVWRRLIELPVPRPESVCNDVPREVSTVVMRALERDAKLRFPSAAAFADALEAAARATGLHAGHRDVAAFVATVSGDRLSERREKVREWLSQRDATAAAGPMSSESGPAWPPDSSDVKLRGSAAPESINLLPTTPSPGYLPGRTPVGVAPGAGPGTGSAPGVAPGSWPGTANVMSPAYASHGSAPGRMPHAGSGPRLVESDPGHAAMPYHWSVNGTLPPTPVSSARTALPWAIAICAVAALAAVAAVPIVKHVRARSVAAAAPSGSSDDPTRRSAQSASDPSRAGDDPARAADPSRSAAGAADPRVDPRVATDPPSPPSTGVVPSASSARPARPRPAVTGKNADFGDRW